MMAFVEFAAVYAEEKIENFLKRSIIDCNLYSRNISNFTLISNSPFQDKADTYLEEGECYSYNPTTQIGRGTFTKIVGQGEEILIIPDYLGSRVLFYFSDGDIKICSNSMNLMHFCLKRSGISIKINYIALSSTFTMGNLQLPDTPICGVKTVPSEHYVSLSRRGVMPKRLIDRSVDLMSDQALRFRAADEVRKNLAAAAEQCDRLFLEVSGGIDSRICLAAALSLGLAARIALLTRGGAGTPDRVCAERFAFAYDLEFAEFPYRPQLLSVQDFLANGAFCAGVRWFDDAAFRMKNYDDSFLVITGGMGEVFRNFYAGIYFDRYQKGNAFFDQVFTEALAREHYSTFSSKTNMVARGIDLEGAIADHLCSQGRTIGQTLFHQYVQFRNRFHFGGAAAARGTKFKSFDPLYTVAGYELAKRQDTEWQLHGELSFELINELFPALNTFPLAEKIVAPRFRAASKEKLFYEKGHHSRPGISSLIDRPEIRNTIRHTSGEYERPNDVTSEAVRQLLDNPGCRRLLKVKHLKDLLETRPPDAVRSMEKAVISSIAFLWMVNHSWSELNN